MVGLLAENHEIIMMDNRGTGRSGKPDTSYMIDLMASDCKGVLDHIGIEKAHVLGFSMGGIITQMFGINYPENTLSLILCGTTPGGEYHLNLDPQIQTDLALIAKPLPEMTERDRTILLLYLLYSKNYVENNLEALIEDETYTENPTPTHALLRQSEAIAGFDSYDRLPEVQVPCLVMTGEDDLLVPSVNSEIIYERLENAELVKIPDSGHGFLKQKTVDVVPLILDFLEKVDKG